MAVTVCSISYILQAVWILCAPLTAEFHLCFSYLYSVCESGEYHRSDIYFVWSLSSQVGWNTILSFCIENPRQASGFFFFFCGEKQILLLASTLAISDY